MKRKTILSIIGLLILVAGITVGVYLVREQQLIGQKAVTPGGTATMRLSPDTATIASSETATIDILFDVVPTEAISNITVRLVYDHGGNPAATIEDPLPNEALIDNSWRYTRRTTTNTGTETSIEIIASNISPAGYTPNGETILATVPITGDTSGTVTLVFDPANTEVYSKAQAVDILSPPQDPAGTYTIGSGTAPSATPTPSPTPSGGANPSVTPSPTPGPGTPTNTPAPTAPPGATNTPAPSTTPPTGNAAQTLAELFEILSPKAQEVLTTTTPIFSGKATPNASISFEVNSAQVVTGSTTADAAGNWSWQTPTALAGGDHTATITASDGADSVTRTVSFTISTQAGDTELPDAGRIETTLLLILLGIGTLGLGLFTRHSGKNQRT